MKNNEWDIFLYSKVRGGEYDNIAGSIEIAENWLFNNRKLRSFINENIEVMTPTSDSIFILTTSSKQVLFGIVGVVKKYLGKNDPQSWDRKLNIVNGGRIKPFFLGYTITLGSSLPSLENVQKLRPLIKNDLIRLFKEAEKNFPHMDKSKKFNSILPITSFASKNLWDETIDKIQIKGCLDGMVVYNKRKISFIKYKPMELNDIEIKKCESKIVNEEKEQGTSYIAKNGHNNLLVSVKTHFSNARGFIFGTKSKEDFKSERKENKKN